MASGTADLQRDLGGAIMQSILGAVLTAGYASAVGAAIADAPNKKLVTDRSRPCSRSRSPARPRRPSRHPQYAEQIVAGGERDVLPAGRDWAYTAGIVAILVGAALIFLLFPKHDRERELLASTTPKTPRRPSLTRPATPKTVD